MRVAIIGGGIGGLTLLLALYRKGIEAHLFEQAAEWRQGAGIWVPSNGMQVIDRLGIADEVRRQGEPVEQIEMWDCDAGLLQSLDLRVYEQRFGFATIAIERARLHAILAAAAPQTRIHMAAECRSVQDNGAEVRLSFADGSESTADLVVGSDGINSTVRRLHFPDVTLRYSGQSSYRAIVAARLGPQFSHRSRELWAPGRRFGFSSIGGGRAYWWCAFDAPRRVQDRPGEAFRNITALASGFPPPIPALVEAAEPAGLIRTDLEDFKPIPTWHRGRIVLLGDAAHASTPNLGQGGAQALEDAFVLAEQLSQASDPETAFSRYEAIRRVKAAFIVNRSWTMGKLGHLSNPFLRRIRNAALKTTPARFVDRQLDALYSLNF